MTPIVFAGPADLARAVGSELGVSDWLTIDQDRINLFADATGDHQWIHVDPDRAASGPFGSAIAHGYLTLSLVNYFLPQIVEVQGISMGVNYGTEKVRFPAPVTVGSSVRGRGVLSDVKEIPGGAQATITVASGRVRAANPACVVDTVSRFIE